jgi:hypothetical protein
MSGYKIERRELPVVVGGGHYYLTLVDGNGKLISEMHGLATSATGETKPIGSTLLGDKIKYREYNGDHPNTSDNGIQYRGDDAGWSGYYDKGHASEVIASGDEQTIMDLWNKARAAGEAINAQDIGYSFYGGGRGEGNSNSVNKTLLDAMDKQGHDLSWRLTPGDQKDLLHPSHNPFAKDNNTGVIGLPQINPLTGDKFKGSQRSSSPLVFDLDGDGVEITQLTGDTRSAFDLDADGLRTRTAWVGPDDGLLAMDINGNGLIDSGRELFGDSTVLRNGKMAANGYGALGDLDTNKDGLINAQDTAFTLLRIWRDQNQNGVSESGELFSLAQTGISDIKLSKTACSQTLADGTKLDGTASFTIRGQTQTYTDAWFAQDPFHSEFTSHLPLSDAAKALPDIAGAGAVRSLAEAATQSPALLALIEQFQQAGTHDAQMALMDPLLKAWADTSPLVTLSEWEAAGHTVTYAFFGQDSTGNSLWKQRLSVLEAFNGENYRTLARTGKTAISTASDRQALLQQSYDALDQSVYGAMVLQTRLRPYLDAIALVNDDAGVHLDTKGLDAALDAKWAQDPDNALLDLVDLTRYGTDILKKLSFDATGKLRAWVDALPTDAPMRSTLTALSVLTPGTASTGSKGADIFLGNALANRFSGGDNNDIIDGGDGNDRLNGGGGDDMLIGGNGNDSLNGGTGNDTLLDMSATSADVYNWGRGQGDDVLLDQGGNDRLDIASGVTADQLWLSRVNNDLVLAITDTHESLTIQGWFASADHQVERIKLGDGKTLSASQANQLVAAMASMAPPPGQTVLSTENQAALQQLIASSWV